MIVVVEGPSGAGKTTWCRTHARSSFITSGHSGARSGVCLEWDLQREASRKALRPSLMHWYRAIDELESGRVRFGLPDAGLTPDLLALFERLLARLD